MFIISYLSKDLGVSTVEIIDEMDSVDRRVFDQAVFEGKDFILGVPLGRQSHTLLT